MNTLKRFLGRVWYRPGSFFYRTRLRQHMYKLATFSYPYCPPAYNYPHPMERRGFAAIPRIDTQELVQQCLQHVNVSHAGAKPYMVDLLQGKGLVDKRYQPLALFAVTPVLVLYVAAYFRERPKLTAVKLLRSTPSQPPYTGSQLWHRDHDDLRQVKLFVPVYHVEEEHGPLEFYPANTVRVPGYRFGGEDGHMPDHVFAPHAAQYIPGKLCAAPGRVFAIDTSRCFHRGSRVQRGQRLLYMAQYVTQRSFV